jgi:hypothetical protein
MAGGQAGSKAHVAVSNDAGVTFNTDIPLDAASALRSNRTVIEAHGEFAAVHFEMGVNGQNRVAYSWTNDSGATWAEGEQVVNTGPDSDSEGTFNGPWFRFNPVTHVALSAYWDRIGQNWNELYASAVRVPAVIVASGAATKLNDRYLINPGSTVSLGVVGVPVSEGPSSTFTIAVSQSGFAPAAQIGPLQFHLAVDGLTLGILTNPAVLPLLSGGTDPTGAGVAVPFPWPFLTGSPDIFIAAIVQNGASISHATDPARLITQ